MKLHYSIKRQGMKYPRATNRCLDVGIVLLLAGAVGTVAEFLGLVQRATGNLSIGALIVGFVLWAAAMRIARIDHQMKPEPASLRRVK